MKRLLLTLALLLVTISANARGKLQGYVEKGGASVRTSGALSTTKVQESFTSPHTATVYLAGTSTVATIYSAADGTAKANPFTVSTTGKWEFWAEDGDYDVTFKTAAGVVVDTLSSLRIVGGVPVFNVSTFGAKCNGTDNDVAAFNLVKTAADTADAVIEIPASTSGCFLSSPWNFNNLSNVTIRGSGYGSWIKCGVGASACIGGSTLTNVILENFRVGGTSSRAVVLGASGTVSSGVIARHMWVSGASTADVVGGVAGMQVWECTDCVVDDVQFSGNGPGSVAYDTSDLSFSSSLAGTGNIRPKIINNISASTSVNLGIACFDCSYGLIQNNNVTGTITRTGGSSSGYGLMVYDQTGTKSQHMRILGNHVKDTQGSGLYIAGGGTIGFHDVAGNTFENVATTQDETLPVGCIVVANSFGVAVVGNVCRASGKHGIDLSVSSKLSVIGNYIQLPTLNAISLRGLVEDSNISTNTGTGCGSGIGVYSGGATVNNNIFSSNRFICTNAGFDFNAGIAATGIGNSIVFNNLVGSDTVAKVYVDYGSLSETQRRGNRFTTGAVQGFATLVAGEVNPQATIEVQTGDQILLTRSSLSGAGYGHLLYRSIVDDTSFRISSTDVTDTGTVFWEIIH